MGNQVSLSNVSVRASRVGAGDEAQQRSRRGSSSASSAPMQPMQRNMAQGEGARRRGGDIMSLVRNSDSTTDVRGVLLNPARSTSSAQRRQPREGRGRAT